MPTTRGRLMLIAALLAASPAARGADPALDSPEQKVLDRWVGAWKSSYKVLESPWTPEERALTADVSSKRAVGGRFVEEHTVHSDGTHSMRVFTYDAAQGQYRGWWFSSTGQTAEQVGLWDEASKTFTFRSVGDAPVKTTVTTRFADDDRCEWRVAVTDGAGKVLFQMEGKSERVHD